MGRIFFVLADSKSLALLTQVHRGLLGVWGCGKRARIRIISTIHPATVTASVMVTVNGLGLGHGLGHGHGHGLGHGHGHGSQAVPVNCFFVDMLAHICV